MLSLLGSRNTALHHKKSSRLPRTSYENGIYSMKQQPLVDAAKILMPPLNVELDLIKQFVKQVPTGVRHSSRFKSGIQNCQGQKSKLEYL